MKRIIIDNIETKYLISANGEVFSEYKNIFFKYSTTQHGYSSVTLSVNGKKIMKYIHRLVAEYYLGFQEKGGRVINHIDGNKQNNNISNLEIISSSENLLHAYKMGLKEKNNKKTKKFFENLENEQWKEISNFDGDYEVSNYGRIKSNKYNSPILLRYDIRCGYYSVLLSKKWKIKTFFSS